MKKPEENKCLLGAKGFAAFCDQFGEGNSIYKRVLLEVFFEELLNGKNVPVPGEKEQEGPEDNILPEGEEKGIPNPTDKPEGS